MRILTRYITKTMAFYTAVVVLIWLGVYGFLNFIDEIDKIGQANYTTLKALIYVVMDLPAVAYSHSSMIILLGALLALSRLAATSQLIIVRAAGLSISQISQIVVKVALIFIFIFIFFGELLVPITAEYAESSRAKALSQNIKTEDQQGFWLKDRNTIIHVKKNFDGRLFEDVTLISISQLKQLDSILHADRAAFDDNKLNLEKTHHYQLNHSNEFVDVQADHQEKYSTKVSFDRSLIDSLAKDPYALSIWRLYKQIDFLTKNNLAADAFEVEFYKRLVKPITLVTMILFSMLFIFTSLRDTSLGGNVFFGLGISLCFELVSRISGALSLRFDYNHLLTAAIPTLIALAGVLFLLKIKSAKP